MNMRDVAKRLRKQADAMRETVKAIGDLGKKGVDVATITPDILEDLSYVQCIIATDASMIKGLIMTMGAHVADIRGVKPTQEAIDRGRHAAMVSCDCSECTAKLAAASKAN